MADLLNIREYRILIGQRPRLTTPKPGECRHNNLLAEEHGEIVRCSDCQAQVSAYWALMRFGEQYRQHLQVLDAQRQSLNDDIEKAKHLRAAVKIEEDWRRRKFIPTCPHCRKPITSEDRFGSSQVNRERYGQGALPMEFKPVLKIVGVQEQSCSAPK